MFAFPGMLVKAAEEAGMKVPPDPENFKAKDFPHFHVFCVAQLGARMPYPGVHMANAQIIAGIPKDRIMKVTPKELVRLGFRV